MTPAGGAAVKVMPHVGTDAQTAVFGPSPMSFIFTVFMFFFFSKILSCDIWMLFFFSFYGDCSFLNLKSI